MKIAQSNKPQQEGAYVNLILNKESQRLTRSRRSRSFLNLLSHPQFTLYLVEPPCQPQVPISPKHTAQHCLKCMLQSYKHLMSSVKNNGGNDIKDKVTSLQLRLKSILQCLAFYLSKHRCNTGPSVHQRPLLAQS